MQASEGWRRRPDLNRGWRFCRPLPYHLATAPVGINCTKEGSGRDSDAATTACEGEAVPHRASISHVRRPRSERLRPQASGGAKSPKATASAQRGGEARGPTERSLKLE